MRTSRWLPVRDETDGGDTKEALDQQEALTEFADANQLGVKTAVLENVTDGWAAAELRRAQAASAETIWFFGGGPVLKPTHPTGGDIVNGGRRVMQRAKA